MSIHLTTDALEAYSGLEEEIILPMLSEIDVIVHQTIKTAE